MSNPYIKKPLWVSVYNPQLNIITRNYFMVGRVSKTALNALNNGDFGHYGGNDLKDFDDIDDTNAAPSAINNVANQIDVVQQSDKRVYSTLAAYPEDTIADMKNKIFIMTNIPPYRQHIFYSVGSVDDGVNFIVNSKSANLLTKTPYQLTVNGEYYDINIQNYNKDTTNQLHNINIDVFLEQQREYIQVVALDTFTTLQISEDNFINHIFVADLEYILADTRAGLISILDDNFKFDLIYYGFIIKYWPQIHADAFNLIITGDRQGDFIRDIYPGLEPSLSALKTRYDQEQKIIDLVYGQINSVRKKYYQRDRANIAVTSATMNVTLPNYPKNTGSRINVRNIFDWLSTSIHVPAMTMRFSLQYDGQERLRTQYLNIVKRHISVYNPRYKNYKQIRKFINKIYRRPNVSFAVYGPELKPGSDSNNMIYLTIYEDGEYIIEGGWSEDDRMSFQDILNYFDDSIKDILTQINKMSAAALPHGMKLLSPQQSSNISLSSLNVITFWPYPFSTQQFNDVRHMWKKYEAAGIVSIKNFQQYNICSFLFKKGIINYDPLTIQRITLTSTDSGFLQNTYAYLTDVGVIQKWNYIYSGRNVKIFHRITNLKIEMVGVDENEFNLIWGYIFTFLDSMTKNVHNTESHPKHHEKSSLKLLHEQDPNLYDVRKYDMGATVYSVICQSPRPPKIHTVAAYEKMSKQQKNKAVKFWNFTERVPVYYTCDNKQFPHLSFLTGRHPLNYCLPCCQKTRANDGSKRFQRNRICEQKYQISEDDQTLLDQNKTSRHVLTYGKTITPGRISLMSHQTAEELLFNTLPIGYNYRLLGVLQTTSSINDAGLFYSLAEILSIEPDIFVRDLCDLVRRSENTFHIWGNGRASSFESCTALANAIFKSFITDESFTEFSPGGIASHSWKHIILELTRIIYGLYIIIFNDPDGMDNVNIEVSPEVNSMLLHSDNIKIGVVFNVGGIRPGTYPMVVTNSKIKTLTISNKNIKKIFYRKDNHIITDTLVNSILDMLQKYDKIQSSMTLKNIKKAVSGRYKIIKKLVNLRNYCYGVLVKDLNNEDYPIYLPLKYSSYFTDGIEVKYGPRPELNNTAHQVLELIKNIDIDIIPAQLLEFKDEFIGFISQENCYYYFNSVSRSNLPESLASLPSVYIPYDPRHIDRLIYKTGHDKTRQHFPERANKLANIALYENYLYRFFMIEFVKILQNDSNREIRMRLKQSVRKTSFRDKDSLAAFKKCVIELLSDFPNDIIRIQNGIFDIIPTEKIDIKKAIIAMIDNIKFDFDHCTLHRLRKLSKKAVKKELDEMMRSHIILVDDVDIDGSINIYFGCNVKSVIPQTQCRDNKLIVKKDKYPVLLDILINDIMNPLKTFAVTTILSGVVNKLRFIQRPGEILTFKI